MFCAETALGPTTQRYITNISTVNIGFPIYDVVCKLAFFVVVACLLLLCAHFGVSAATNLIGMAEAGQCSRITVCDSVFVWFDDASVAKCSSERQTFADAHCFVCFQRGRFPSCLSGCCANVSFSSLCWLYRNLLFRSPSYMLLFIGLIVVLPILGTHFVLFCS